ncbi:hypothetical protein ACSNOI_43700 [Actinomadura kijaniata]|uniref:hypothetical protein n=1 Tax=Actinomadura kijaniata TaxID=46161 RepID=UPI003F194DCF
MTTPATETRHPAVPTKRPEPPAKRPEARVSRLVTFARGRWLRTVPGRIRLLTALAIAAVAVVAAVVGSAVENARDGVRTIGRDAGPSVVATGDLYFALSDMDAQVADILLIGREHSLGIGRQGSLQRYEQRRAEAGQAAIKASQLAGSDPRRQQNVREILDGLGRYERMVGEALTLAAQDDRPAGPPRDAVIEVYRQATDLMKLEVLPKAYNVTLDSGAIVRQSYEDERGAVLNGRNWVLVAGVAALLVLLGLQTWLARGFRRLVNPALALATIATVVLVAAGAMMLSAQAGHLKRAKVDGFDSLLTLSRARALSHSAFADESRFLLDPKRADTYEQIYLDKALSVLYVDPDPGRPVNLESYYPAVERDLNAYRGAPQTARFLGFLGEQARRTRTTAQTGALGRALRDYRAVLRNDQRIRQMVQKGDRTGAIRLRMGRDSGAIRDFDAFDSALVELASEHRRAFDRAITGAEGGLDGWQAVPLGSAVAIAVLVLAGVRPRLAEFR